MVAKCNEGRRATITAVAVAQTAAVATYGRNVAHGTAGIVSRLARREAAPIALTG